MKAFGAFLLRVGAFPLHWLQQVGIAIDQFLNAVSTGWADETLSARCGRNYLKGRRLARLFKPVLDLLFAWQKSDPTIKDENGPIVSHCIRAYHKEKLRRQLPPEYR